MYYTNQIPFKLLISLSNSTIPLLIQLLKVETQRICHFSLVSLCASMFEAHTFLKHISSAMKRCAFTSHHFIALSKEAMAFKNTNSPSIPVSFLPYLIKKLLIWYFPLSSFLLVVVGGGGRRVGERLLLCAMF